MGRRMTSAKLVLAVIQHVFNPRERQVVVGEEHHPYVGIEASLS